MATTFHVSLDIRDALGWSDAKLAMLLGDENGDKLSASEARSFLENEIAEGREVLPMTDCDNFDGTGCRGHQSPT